MSAAPVLFRDARLADLPAIIGMLAEDMRGAGREDASLPLDQAYVDAFEAIDNSPTNHQLVAEIGAEVVGCLQITFTPGLSHKGGWRATIEGVRVAAHRRGQGIGDKMLRHAVFLAQLRGCHLVQLTTNKARRDAQRFYARLGFENSHEGFKLQLRDPA